MNILAKIKEKRDALKNYRLKKAENKAFNLEIKAKEEKQLASAITRQSEAKAVIKQARREQHPILFKIGDSVKNKLANAHNQKATKKISPPKTNMFGGQSNPFMSSGDTTPYWLKPQKKGKDTRPYWLK